MEQSIRDGYHTTACELSRAESMGAALEKRLCYFRQSGLGLGAVTLARLSASTLYLMDTGFALIVPVGRALCVARDLALLASTFADMAVVI